jgi:E3 ubiquitin-protein ligase BRE1
MKAEADARQQLSAVEAQLEKYKMVYGDPSSLPLDASKLAEQLQQKEDENHRLRLLDTQRSQVRRFLFLDHHSRIDMES